MPRLSTLAENLTAETAFTVLALARKLEALGKDVVELEIGDSPFPSTPHAKAAGIQAIEENQTGYGPSLGLPRLREAAAIWEKLIEVAADRAYLAFDRLEALAIRTGNPERFTRLCRRLIDDNAQDWRARLALSRHLAASVQNPHALSIHQAIWRALGQLHHPASLVDRYGELTKNAVFYLDPHVCMRCRYRSTELLWQCPHCHDWNTFVEERIAPALDTLAVEV